MNKIIVACDGCAALAEEFAWLLTPVAIDSREAEEARERYQKNLELTARMKERRDRPLLVPPPSQRVSLSLRRNPRLS